VVVSVTAALGVLAGTAGLLVVLPKVTGAVKALGLALTFLTANPIGMLVGALGLGVGGLVWALSGTEEALDDTKEAAKKAGEEMGNLGTDAETAATEVSAAVDSLVTASDIMDTIGKATGDIRRAFVQRFGELPEIVGIQLDEVDRLVGEESGVIAATFTDGMMSIRGESMRLGEDVVAALADPLAVVSEQFNGATGAISESAQAAEGALGQLSDKGTDHADTLIQKFKDVGQALPDALRVSINELSRALSIGYNDLFVPYINNIFNSLNSLASIPGAPTFLGQMQPVDTFDFPQFRSGTLATPGGLAMVGEGGPELALLPSGSQVVDAPNTGRMMSEQQQATLSNGRTMNNYGTVVIEGSGESQIMDLLADLTV
jgi:hypothetical protein